MLAGDLALGLPPLESPGGATATISGNLYEATAVGATPIAALAEVRVQLLGPKGTVLDEQLTDDSGAYQFEVVPGEYGIRQQGLSADEQGAAQVGPGGGVALGMNQVSEIVVHWGETLSGYDFYEFINGTVSATTVDQVVPILQLSLQPSAPVVLKPLNETVELVFSANEFSPLPLAPIPSRQEATFSGSSRRIQPTNELRDWDDDSFDSWISTASYAELADANSTAAKALEPLLDDAREDELGDPDAPFADGYTAESLDWLQTDAETDAAFATLSATPKPTPRIAHRPDAPEAKSPRQATRQPHVPAKQTPGRTVQLQRAAAIDQAVIAATAAN